MKHERSAVVEAKSASEGKFPTGDYLSLAGSTLCYSCGETGADTSDHVVPKTCYVPPLPVDVVTLPAHLACNQSISLLRDHAKRLRRNYFASLTPHPSGGAFIDLGKGRVEYVPAKMVMGLLFKQEGLLLSQDHTWSIKAVNLALMVEQEFTQILQVHDVAVFRWALLGSTAFWALALYNMHIFSGVAVDPVDFERLAARVPRLADGIRLPWPKPNDV